MTSATVQTNTLCYFTAILEQRTVLNTSLCPSCTPRLHPTGNCLQSRHLWFPYLGLSQTLASSLAFYPPLNNIYPLTNSATDPIPMCCTTKPKAIAHHLIWLVSTFMYFPLQAFSAISSASMACSGNAAHRNAMCKGSMQSKPLPHACVKNVRHACLLFVCI